MAKILIVDDSELDRSMLRRMLEKIGAQNIIEAENGTRGTLLAKAEQPDLIFMDVVMDGISGFEATDILAHRQSETSGIPIVICSSRAQPTDILWGKQNGARAHLVKPLTLEAVAQVIAEIGLQ